MQEIIEVNTQNWLTAFSQILSKSWGSKKERSKGALHSSSEKGTKETEQSSGVFPVYFLYFSPVAIYINMFVSRLVLTLTSIFTVAMFMH